MYEGGLYLVKLRCLSWDLELVVRVNINVHIIFAVGIRSYIHYMYYTLVYVTTYCTRECITIRNTFLN